MKRGDLTTKIKGNVEHFFWACVAIISLIVFWQLLVSFTAAKNTFPAPIEVFDALISALSNPIGKYTLLGHIGWSLYRVLVSFTIASVSGIIIGLLMGWSRLAEAAIKPIFEMLRPIPAIAWIPLAILWFGIGESTKYFIIFIGAFVNVTLNAYAGAKRVDPVLVGAAKMLGARDRQVFSKIVLPSSVPQIFAGLQLALSTSWMTVLAAEMVRSSEGTGWIIIMGMETGNTVQIVVGMISIGIVGLLLATLMRGVERKLCSWNIRGT